MEHIDSLCAASQLPHVSVDSRVNLLATLNVLGSMLVKVSGSAAALSVSCDQDKMAVGFKCILSLCQAHCGGWCDIALTCIWVVQVC